MWRHYCKVEKDTLDVAKGCACNWCGKTEIKKLKG